MASFAPNWWESTGFLQGTKPTVDPDDPYRISTAILPVYPPLGWQFQATGSLYPGAPVQWQGGMSSYTPAVTSDLFPAPLPRACLDACTMGGCADPTSFAHAGCVASGCCSLQPAFTSPPTFDSQRAYISTNCEPGTKEYCHSDLDYFNCMPYSTLTPSTDPTCAGFLPVP